MVEEPGRATATEGAEQRYKSLVEHALALAERGYWIFPLAPGKKTPAMDGWQEWATRDLGKLCRYWAELPDANIGIYTGKYYDSGSALFVIDEDNKGDKNGRAELDKLVTEGNDLPPTYTQLTPSGGRHLVYHIGTAVRGGVNLLARGLDIKSRGGYIVGAGSKIGPLEYTADGRTDHVVGAPAWAVSRCGVEKKIKVPAVLRESPDDLAWAESYLASQPIYQQGERNNKLFVFCARLKGQGLSKESTYYFASRLQMDTEMSEVELQTTVASAYKNTTIHSQGSENAAAMFEDCSATEFAAKDAPISPFTRKLPHELVGMEFADPLIEGYLDQGEIAVLLGPSQQGKTFALINICFSIASGTPWAGQDIERGCVVLCAAEAPNSAHRRAIAAYRQFRCEDRPVPVAVLSGPFDLRKSETVDGVIAEARRLSQEFHQPVRLVAFDTLHMATPGMDENSAKDMGEALAGANKIRLALDATVILVHHTGKDATKGARGSSALLCDVTTQLLVTREGGTVWIESDKQRDGEIGQREAFRMERVMVGQTAKGKQVTTCVLHHDVDKARLPRPKDLTDRQKAVVREIDSQACVGAFSGGPSGRIDRGALMRALASLPTFVVLKETSRDRVIRRELGALAQAGRIGINDKEVWLLPGESESLDQAPTPVTSGNGKEPCPRPASGQDIGRDEDSGHRTTDTSDRSRVICPVSGLC